MDQIYRDVMALDEFTVELFDEYKSRFELLFSVSLDTVSLHAPDKEFYAKFDIVIRNEFKGLGSLINLFVPAYKTYIWMASLHASGHHLGYDVGDDKPDLLVQHRADPETEKNAYVLIHELAHAVQCRMFGIFRSGKEKPVWQTPIKRAKGLWLDLCIAEGFAEYTAIRTFEPHYGLNMDETIEDILHLHTTGKLSARLKKKAAPFRRAMFKAVGWLAAKPYREGFRFFDQVCHHGFSSLDVLANPPQSYAEIKHPHLYLKRRFTTNCAPSSIALGSHPAQ